MKARTGFVSNSSSTSFVLQAREPRDVVELIVENAHLLGRLNDEFGLDMGVTDVAAVLLSRNFQRVGDGAMVCFETGNEHGRLVEQFLLKLGKEAARWVNLYA